MKTLKSILAAMFLLAAVTSHAQVIFDAVANNDLLMVKHLLEKDASIINLKDQTGNTPLHIAALNGSVAIAELLLSKAADIDAVNTQLNTPLHLAIINGKDEVSKLLIEKGSDLKKQNVVGKTPLHLTVRHNRKAIAELLIAKGSEIDSRDDRQRTPLGLAARETGNVDIARLLIQKGADINAKDVHNQMPLNFAAWKGFNHMIDLLLDNEADFDTTRGTTRQMLSFAAGCGSFPLFKAILDKENTLLSNESFNRRIMRTAIMGGSVEIVNSLLAKDIPLNNDANSYSWTPAHYAAAHGHAAMIRFLIAKNIDITQRTLSGKSVYNVAEENNQSEVLKLIAALQGDTSPQKFPELKGTYLGQTPPGNEPKLFAPDIISTASGNEPDNHGGLTFTPDGKEIYWDLRQKIWMIKMKKDRWTKPEVAPFSYRQDDKYSDDSACLTPDGKKLFFISRRPGAVSENKENIWFVERTESGWSEPKPVHPEVNALQIHWRVSVSNSGILYFGGQAPDGMGGYDIYCSRLVDGEYTKPINLGPTINSKEEEMNPYIAPDESYVIFCRLATTLKEVYISFKGKEGQWLQPIKLPQNIVGLCPVVSPDGKYLFLSGIRWVDAKFIEELGPKN